MGQIKPVLATLRSRAFAIAAVLFILLCVGIVVSSATFQECVETYAYSGRSNYLYEILSAARWCGVEFFDLFGDPIIAAFTIILGGGTIWLAVATQRLAIGAEKNAERQLRAYVFIEKAGINDFYNNARIQLNITLKNSGQTPARNVVVWANMKVADRNNPGDFGDAAVQPQNKTNLPPNGKLTTTFDMTPVPAQIQTAFANGQYWGYVWGAITYVDVFDRPQTTNFKVFARGGEGPAALHLSYCEDGNEAT